MTAHEQYRQIDDEPGEIDMAAAVLAAQPFNDLVGATITRFGDGTATLELAISDRHRQQYGLVHGGVLAYLVDNTLTFACGTVLGTNIITTGVNVTYLSGARDGLLRATATVTAHTGRHAAASVVIEEIAPDGTVRACAAGQGTAAIVGRRENKADSNHG